MAGGYSHKPPGTEGLAGVVKDIQAQIAAIRSGAGIRSAVIRDSQLIFTTKDGEGIGTFGTFPYASLDADLQRTTNVAKGALFEADDGENLLLAVQYESGGSTEAQLSGDIVLIRAGTYGDFVSQGVVNIRADGATDSYVALSSTALDVRIAHDTTASAANAHLDPSTARIYRSTSGRKYKTDITPADVDPADVLSLTAQTWVDKGELDRNEPGDLRRYVGFIADELDEHPSLRQFVDYDENGEPDAIQYDRLSVALLAVIKDQQARIDDHEERLNRLENGGQ